MRIGQAQPIGEIASAHLRHDHIGQEQVDRAGAVSRDEIFGVVAAGGFDHVVAEIAQHADGKMTYADVVFENKDGLGTDR